MYFFGGIEEFEVLVWLTLIMYHASQGKSVSDQEKLLCSKTTPDFMSKKSHTLPRMVLPGSNRSQEHGEKVARRPANRALGQGLAAAFANAQVLTGQGGSVLLLGETDTAEAAVVVKCRRRWLV